MSDRHRKEDGEDDAPLRDTELVAIIELLLASSSRVGASWRVPEDAVDRTYDKLVDRIIEGFPPDAPRSWAWQVLMNSLRAGPERSELRSRNMREMPESMEALRSVDGVDSLAEKRRFVDQLDTEVRRILTESEYAGFRAMLTEPSMTAAARASGMSKRDLHMRRTRIVKKIRRLLASEEGGSTSELK